MHVASPNLDDFNSLPYSGYNIICPLPAYLRSEKSKFVCNTQYFHAYSTYAPTTVFWTMLKTQYPTLKR